MSDFEIDHTPKQTQALWASAAHWLDNWQDPLHAKTTARHCACCRAFLRENACHGCPICEYTGQDFCRDTPWSDAAEAVDSLEAGRSPMQDLIDRAREDIEREYRFLVSLALGEHPQKQEAQED